MTEAIIPTSVGELLDDCNLRATELLLNYAEDNHQNFDALWTERLNFLGSLTWTYQNQHWLTVIDYALVLDAFLDTRGYWEEDKHNLELALEAVDQLGPDHKNRKALLLHNVAAIYMAQGDNKQARSYFERSLALQHQLGNTLAIGRTLHYIGRIHAAEGEHEQARQHYEKSLALGKEANDKRGVGASLHELGNLHLDQGAYSEVEDYYKQSLILSEEIGDIREVAATLYQLGVLKYHQTDFDGAEDYLTRALHMQREVGYQEGIADNLFTLGRLAYDQENEDHAKRLWYESLRIYEYLGTPKTDTVRARLSTLTLL